MKIHHLNCASLCPRAPRWALREAKHLVCHCLLIETGRELILVDTGFGTEDVLNPGVRLTSTRFLLGPRLDLSETALHQVRALGFDPRDVRHIVLTHLDSDHAGGLSDFPQAKVHLYAPELEVATQLSKTFVGHHRYRALHWSHGPDWQLYSELEGDKWFGFEAVRALAEVEPEILLVPLIGHTTGHCGVAVRDGTGWMLHAGDAYFYYGEVESPAHVPLGMMLFQKSLAMDERARVANQKRLRELKRTTNVRMFCAHDVREFNQIRLG